MLYPHEGQRHPPPQGLSLQRGRNQHFSNFSDHAPSQTCSITDPLSLRQLAFLS